MRLGTVRMALSNERTVATSQRGAIVWAPAAARGIESTMAKSVAITAIWQVSASERSESGTTLKSGGKKFPRKRRRLAK
jgi:hypothetical protein